MHDKRGMERAIGAGEGRGTPPRLDHLGVSTLFTFSEASWFIISSI